MGATEDLLQGTKVTADLTTADTATASFTVRGAFNVSIAGTWVGTIQLRRRYAGDTQWAVVESFTTNVETIWAEIERGVEYQLYANGMTSGTARARLSR